MFNKIKGRNHFNQAVRKTEKIQLNMRLNTLHLCKKIKNVTNTYATFAIKRDLHKNLATL